MDVTRDKRIAALASEVSTASNNVIPKLLLRITPILESYPQGSRPLIEIKQSLWEFGLLHVALTALKQDFSKILDGWNTASRLAGILCQSCVGLDPKACDGLDEEVLPDVLQTLLVLARKLQLKHSRVSDVLEDTKKDILSQLQLILDGITALFSSHDALIDKVMQSPWFLQLLVTDDAKTAIAVMGLLQNAHRLKRGLMGDLDEKIVHQVLDEVIFKLSTTSSNDLACSATKTLLVLCESHPPVVELLCTRYKGLKPLLNKWVDKGFGRELRRLQLLLEAGSLQQANLQKLHRAARLIQALWRSHKTRKTLKKADRAIGTLQRSFRFRREQEEQRRLEARQQAELQHMLIVSRKNAMRELHRKQMETLRILPAGDVTKHLANENTRAAVKIQAMWRGRRVRASFQGRQDARVMYRAAVTIQMTVRRWLERVRAQKREPAAWQRPPGLTDERRVQLNTVIQDWREHHQIEASTEEKRKDLHERVQGLLRNQCVTSKSRRKLEQHRDLLLARMDTDCSLLLNSPKLNDVVEKDVETFATHSVPIATKARANHNQELRLLRQPWWRKLGDDYQDRKLEEENASWKMF